MIIDHIRNREKYYFLGEAYKLALDFFAEEAEKTLERGEVSLKNDVVIKKCITETKYECDSKFEAHRRFADIHFVVYGVERIGYADVDLLEITDYNEVSDGVHLSGTGELITLRPGYFMITLPDDAHMPCVCEDTPAPLGKMIAKIKL